MSGERLHIVPPAAEGERLDRFLCAVEPDLSRSQVARAVERGEVRVDGSPARKAGQALPAGAQVTLTVPPPAPASAEPQDLPLVIRYQDGDLVVVAKPAGMVVHPAHGHSAGTLVNALLHHCADLSGVGGVLRPGIVHRLDRDTTGLLVVAKHDRAHRALAAQFKARSAYRRYLAVVSGGGRLPGAGTFHTLFGRHPTERKRFSSKVRDGREAITHWRVLLRGDEASPPVRAHVVEVRLETGRTHQIRVHFADGGHAVVGDPVYAGRPKPPHPALALGRQALHAYALGFEHPADGRRLTFREPPPPDLRAGLDAIWGEQAVATALEPLLEPLDHPWLPEDPTRPHRG